MNLTRIKIPGKNKRNQTRAATKAIKVNASRPALPHGRTPEGLSRASSVQSSSSRPTKRHKGLRHLKSKRKMTHLEKLPTELLEAIFLFCLNCSLPRASPIIAGKLSSQHLYIQTLCAAFGPSWDVSFTYLNHGDELLNDHFPESQAYESALLRCRWASLGIWKKAEDAWLRNKAEFCKMTPAFRFQDRASSPPPTAETGRLIPIEHHEATRWLAQYEDVFFRRDFHEYLEWSMQDDSSTDDFPLLSSKGRWNGFLRINPKTDIPDHLLCGPWTEEMLKHFFALARAGATVNFERTTSGEVAMGGIDVAIETGSKPALFLLHAVGCQNCVTVDVFKKAAYRKEQQVSRHVTDSIIWQLLIMMQRPEHLDKLGLTIRRMRTKPPADREDSSWTSWMDHLHGTLIDFLKSHRA